MSKVSTTKSKIKTSSSKKRCFYHLCNRKLGLTDISCRCHHIYCSKHRLPETHACTYNYKNESTYAFMKRVGLGGGEVRKLEII